MADSNLLTLCFLVADFLHEQSQVFPQTLQAFEAELKECLYDLLLSLSRELKQHLLDGDYQASIVALSQPLLSRAMPEKARAARIMVVECQLTEMALKKVSVAAMRSLLLEIKDECDEAKFRQLEEITKLRPIPLSQEEAEILRYKFFRAIRSLLTSTISHDYAHSGKRMPNQFLPTLVENGLKYKHEVLEYAGVSFENADDLFSCTVPTELEMNYEQGRLQKHMLSDIMPNNSVLPHSLDDRSRIRDDKENWDTQQREQHAQVRLSQKDLQQFNFRPRGELVFRPDAFNEIVPSRVPFSGKNARTPFPFGATSRNFGLGQQSSTHSQDSYIATKQRNLLSANIHNNQAYSNQIQRFQLKQFSYDSQAQLADSQLPMLHPESQERSGNERVDSYGEGYDMYSHLNVVGNESDDQSSLRDSQADRSSDPNFGQLNLATFKVRAQYKDTAPLRCCTFDEDGKLLVFGTNNGEVKVIQIEAMLDKKAALKQNDVTIEITDLKALKVHEGSVYCLDWTENHVFTGSNDQTLKILSFRPSQAMTDSQVCLTSENVLSEKESLQVDSTVRTVKSFGQTQVAAGLASGSVLLVDSSRMALIWSLNCHSDQVMKVNVRNKNILVTGGLDGLVCFIDTRNQSVILQADLKSGVNDILVCGEEVFIALVDGQICKLEMRKHQIVSNLYLNGLSHLHEAKCLDSKDGMIASGGFESLVKLYDSDTASVVKTFEHHSNKVLDLKWSPSLPMLATTSADKTIAIMF